MINIGVDNKAKEIKNLYIGVDNKAKQIVRAYIGVDGKAKQIFGIEGKPVITSVEETSNGAKVIFVLPEGNFESIYITAKKGSIPTSYTDGISKSLNPTATESNFALSEMDKYYFIIFMKQTNQKWIKSNYVSFDNRIIIPIRNIIFDRCGMTQNGISFARSDTDLSPYRINIGWSGQTYIYETWCRSGPSYRYSTNVVLNSGNYSNGGFLDRGTVLVSDLRLLYNISLANDGVLEFEANDLLYNKTVISTSDLTNVVASFDATNWKSKNMTKYRVNLSKGDYVIQRICKPEGATMEFNGGNGYGNPYYWFTDIAGIKLGKNGF